MQRKFQGVSVITLAVAFLCLPIVTIGWLPNLSRRSNFRPFAGNMGLRLSSRAPSTEMSRDLLLIDWDGGCVVDTVPFRIKVALQAAALVWPDLQEKIKVAATSIAVATSEKQSSWLTNKLKAIAPVLHEDTRDFSATAQYVLAVRLLVEEQGLDRGRSQGTGKYGSLYHPQQSQVQEHSLSDSISHGSRPLTVSEVSMNWCELLLYTLPIKYRVRPQQLEEAIGQCMKDPHLEDENDLLPVNTAVASILASVANGQAFIHNGNSEACTRETLPVVTVRHENDLPLAQASIVQHFKDSQVQVKLVDCAEQLWVVSEEGPTIFILHKEPDTVAKLLEQREEERSSTKAAFREDVASVVRIVESSWKALQWDTSRQDHPVVTDEGMDLKLTVWCPTPEMERRATMCPWSSACTSVIELEEQLGIQHAAFE
jgi:hypothetical protein